MYPKVKCCEFEFTFSLVRQEKKQTFFLRVIISDSTFMSVDFESKVLFEITK